MEISLDDLEAWGMFDPGKYNQAGLQKIVKEFLLDMDIKAFQSRVRKLKYQKLIKSQHYVYVIQPQIYSMLHAFLQQKSEELPCRFRKIGMPHILYI